MIQTRGYDVINVSDLQPRFQGENYWNEVEGDLMSLILRKKGPISPYYIRNQRPLAALLQWLSRHRQWAQRGRVVRALDL